MWMNEHDVEDAADQFESEDTPNLMRATQVLRELTWWTNRHSDGWPYWQKPGRAALRLETLIRGKREEFRHGGGRHPVTGAWEDATDATEAEVKKALTPIKTFLTKYQAQTHSTDAEIETILTAGIPKPPTIEEHIQKICHDAGLGVMVQVLEILIDREKDGAEAYVRGLDADDIEALYDSYVGPAIDKIEDEV